MSNDLEAPVHDDSVQKSGTRKGNRNRPSRRKRFVLLVALLLVVSITYCLIISLRQQRIGFVGNIASISRYQCRFTVSENWSSIDQRCDLSHYLSTVFVDQDYFTPRNGNWITQLLSRLQNHGSIPDPPAITLTTDCSESYIFQTMSMQAGYPEPDLYLSERHLMIDGFPATAVSSDRIFTGQHYRGTVLRVFISDGPLLYEVGSWTEASNFAQVDREMQAIVSSFGNSLFFSCGKGRCSSRQ